MQLDGSLASAALTSLSPSAAVGDDFIDNRQANGMHCLKNAFSLGCRPAQHDMKYVKGSAHAPAGMVVHRPLLSRTTMSAVQTHAEGPFG